jgi:RNA polymerase sigma factor (TIGR02999 family)
MTPFVLQAPNSEVGVGERDDSAELTGSVTRLIGQIDAGEPAAQAELCALVYDELRAIGRRMRRRHGDGALETTDIVHEFFGRVLADGRLGQMKNRRYFYAAAADQMRRILIDHWRHKKTQAAGGHLHRQPLEPWLDELTDSAAARSGGDLVALDEALMRLKADRPRQHEVAQLKFFAGLTNEDVAKVLDVSIDTVKRDWQLARARLGALMGERV